MINLHKQHHLSPSQQVHFYTILFFCFCLPLWSGGTVLAIVVLLVNAIFSGALLKNSAQLLHPIALFSIGLYTIYLVGLTYTGDINDGLRDVETKMTLVLFPLIFFTSPSLKSNQKELAMLFFVGGCFVAIGIGVAVLWYYTKYLGIYLNAKFSNQIGIHSSYFCTYLGLGVFFLVQQLLTKKKEVLSLKIKLLYGVLIFIFMVAILNLYARMGTYVLTFLGGVFYLGYKFQQRHFAKGILQTLIALSLLLGLTKLIPAANQALFEAVDIPSVTVEKEAPSDVRLNIWKASLMTFNKQLLFGHGTGDVHVELLKSYKKNQFAEGVSSNFNPHNQYLQTGIALGLLGLFFLIGTFLVAMRFAWQGQHYIYLFFVLLFAMCCLTESMLEMEKGVLFFTFFNSFFGAELLKEKTDKRVE